MSENKSDPAEGGHNQVINTIREVSLKADQLSQLSRIGNAEGQRQALLDCLQQCFDLASTRERLAKHGTIVDPDCHAMIKAVEVAAKISGCERPTLLMGGAMVSLQAFAHSDDDEPVVYTQVGK